ncbi:hypothetical protein PENSPDRAFT_316009 [Peniophora sp. CONT]|nr:hypothetical protein PENSPDRAFT_316009 [Peniophora sp. CONT]
MSTLPAPKEDTPVQPPEHASVPLKESQHDEPSVPTGVSLHETSPRTNLDCLVGGDAVSRDPASQGNDRRSPTSRVRACSCAKGGRNLVVCIDGTSNQFGETNTNVIELYGLIPKDTNDKQRTYYNSGIGTYARPSWKSWAYYKQSVAHKIDLAIAWNFERILLDAYRWLSETYEDGDCIFLFGFSRGAYQVRTLSAMIDKVGLIHRGNEQQIPFAYQLYADFGSSRANTREAGIFKKTFSRRNVKVHFVGAWDTVSSIGMVRSRKPLPGTVEGMKHVCFFRHALALDERRVKFLPEYACGGAGPSPRSVESNHTKEVWFAGTHSDVGGGNVGNLALSNTRPALRWMFSEASAAGLRLDPFERDFQDEEVIGIIESLTIPWKPFEYIPLRRLAYVTATEGWEAGIGALWADCTISWYAMFCMCS